MEINRTYIENNQERFLKQFFTKSKWKHALEDILQFGLENTNPDFTIDDYFRLLYTEPKSFTKVRNDILENIKNGSNFQILHSYAKNGKTTFLKHLAYDSQFYKSKNLDIKFDTFDFSQNTNRSNSDVSTFKNTVHKFLKSFILMGPEIINERLHILIELDEFFSSNVIEYDKGYSDEMVDSFNDLFSNFREEIAVLAKNYLYAPKDTRENLSLKFKSDFNKLINEIDTNQSAELFVYVILLRLITHKKHYERVYDTKPDTITFEKVSVIILDNIDDISSHLAREIATNQAFYISKFKDIADTFSSVFAKLIKNFDFSTDVFFIYSYRTANYINSIQVAKYEYLNESQKYRYVNYFYEAPKHKLTSVKDSSSIVLKKFLFYQELCSILNVQIPKKYLVFKVLTEILENNAKYSKDINLRQVYRLWNGNRSILFNHRFFKQFEKIEIKNVDNDYAFLEKGSYLFFFLTPFYNDYFESNLNEIIDYIFASFNLKNDYRYDLSRLILNLIINTLQEANNDKRKISSSNDLTEKGISLYEILETFDISNNLGEKAYNPQDIEYFLNKLFHDEIDSWGHLLTCTKRTTHTIDNTKYQGKRISFTKEIEDYIEIKNNRGIVSEKERKILNLKNIKFYYNDSAIYLIKYVLPNFEYFSVFCGNKKPLMYCTTYKKNGKNYNFEFEKVIDSVLQNVSSICKASNTFFKKYFADTWSPKEYCNTKLSHNRSFHFKDTISKHLTFIDQFRRYYICSIDSDLTLQESLKDELKNEINTKLCGYLNQYLNLYKITHLRTEKCGELPDSLVETCHSFKELKEILLVIQKNDYYLKLEQKLVTTTAHKAWRAK